MSFAPTDLLAAHSWQKAYFTTYALSLSFFEAVVLDGLVRSRSGTALILADPAGVRASLSERGAQRVGKDYEVEPVAVTGGVFHPKISVLVSADECHVLVGSGNLTFGGWGVNCEVLEHLHPSFAGQAILDTADFFDALGTSNRTRHAASHQCHSIAEHLRAAAEPSQKRGNIRVLHNLSIPIADQVIELAEDLGGATRLVSAAPFWDDGATIDSLAQSLDLNEVFVHVHERGTVTGNGRVANWPRHSRTRINPIQLDALRDDDRRLHAKLFEIVCRSGRVEISGSANCSNAALRSCGNVEACVVRVERDVTSLWTFSPGTPLPWVDDLTETELEAESDIGILRGTLDGDQLSGDVLTPRMAGDVTVLQVTNLGAVEIGRTTVDHQGKFVVTAKDLEQQSWQRGRLVIRVQDSLGRQAEGFIAIAGYADVVRRAGAVARSLFALVNGSEMPADIAAVLEWMHDNPQHLETRDFSAAGPRASGEDEQRDELIPVSSLTITKVGTSVTVAGAVANTPKKWMRFLDLVMESFRERRGRLRHDSAKSGTPESDNDLDPGEIEDEVTNNQEDNSAAPRLFMAFEKLHGLLLADVPSSQRVVTAFDLTEYVCDRLQPDADVSNRWFRRVFDAFAVSGLPEERRDDVFASIVRFASTLANADFRWARSALLHLGADLNGPPPSSSRDPGLPAGESHQGMEASWIAIQRTRTLGEQREALRTAILSGKPSADYPDIPTVAPIEWPVLETAFADPRSRKRIRWISAHDNSCPDHDMSIPESERQKLERVGIAVAKNCCGALLIRTA